MIVGVDIGTQSLKALVCDESLRVLGAGSHAYAYEVPRAGWAEQDPRAWTSALLPAIGAALESAGCSAADVSALGLAGQLDGCIACDDAGEPLGNALIWMDRRAGDFLPTIEAAELLEITGQLADPSHMAAKIAWLEASGLQGAACYHQPVSMVLEQLCGERVFDPGHASTTMLFDQRSGDFSSRLLELFAIEKKKLPRVAAADSLAGHLTAGGAALTGLIEGTAIAVGTGDDFATPLGAGIFEPTTLACVLGTAEVVGVSSTARILDHSGLLETHNHVGDRFFIENPGWLAGGSLRWAIELLGLGGVTELDALAATATADNPVVFIPALSGAMAPRWRPRARAAFYGMSGATGRAELARAVLEGCAFAMNDVVSRLGAMGIGPTDITLLGGGARSHLWAQIRADVSGLAVRVHPLSDTCALGAALLAAVATSTSPSIADAAQNLAQEGRVFHPRADRSAAYARYRALFDQLEPLFMEPS